MPLVGSPGELYTSLGMSMKEKSVLKNTIVVNHVWNNWPEGGYLLDDEGIANNAYGGPSQYKPGFMAPALVELENQLIGETR
jgi:hypothetical protein